METDKIKLKNDMESERLKEQKTEKEIQKTK